MASSGGRAMWATAKRNVLPSRGEPANRYAARRLNRSSSTVDENILVRRKSRRQSLLCLNEGEEGDESDDDSTRAKLARNVELTAEILKEDASSSAADAESTSGAATLGKRNWMPLMMIVLGTPLLSLPLHTWLIGADADDIHGTDLDDRDATNGPVCGILGVASLTYALIFASAYSEAQARLDEIRMNLVQEANGVHTAMLLVRAIHTTNEAHKVRTLLLFASYIFQLGDDIGHDGEWLISDDASDTNAESSSIETLFATVPFLSLMCADCHMDAVHRDTARTLVEQTVEMLKKVSEARSFRETATHDDLSWITSLFLLEMGWIVLMCVCILHTGYAALDLTLQLLTLGSLVTSLLLLADLARPFDGIMQVDVSIFGRIRKSISASLTIANADARASSRMSSRSSRNTCGSGYCQSPVRSFAASEPDEPRLSTGPKVRFEPAAHSGPATEPTVPGTVPLEIKRPRVESSFNTEERIKQAHAIMRRASLSFAPARKSPILRASQGSHAEHAAAAAAATAADATDATDDDNDNNDEDDYYVHQDAAATTIQSQTRGMLARKRFRLTMRAIMTIQRRIRGWKRRSVKPTHH
jgi:hypothetical protein